ncbi:MAG: fatty acid desaturase, partial [Deltaproteobacteria bacterium]|nr:fatty acid desaturase [Deltaproteobacteria bacterium]
MTLTDPIFVPRISNPFDRLMLRLINDQRDLPFIYLILQIAGTVIPFAVYLFIPGNFSWILAALYTGMVLLYFLGPVILMLHNTSHRRLFKKEKNALNYLIPWIIAPFFGQSPETYRAHHVFMHHLENNLLPDLSTTMPYQRDRARDFVRYFCRFFFVGIFDLSRYFGASHRLLKRVLTGEIFFYLLCGGLLFLNWKAALTVLVFPFVVARFAMMAGNWAQHAFIDPKTPDNNFRNSITCVNSTYNRRCFNDGYHIGHHLKASQHWTDMPGDFLANLNRYRSEEAIVFKKIDYFYIWISL